MSRILGIDSPLDDITSTHFEGESVGNPLAQRCYLRDSRPECNNADLITDLGFRRVHRLAEEVPLITWGSVGPSRWSK